MKLVIIKEAVKIHVEFYSFLCIIEVEETIWNQRKELKEYQHLIGKIIIAIAIIVAAIIIAGAIEGAGANIQSGLWKLRDALR